MSALTFKIADICVEVKVNRRDYFDFLKKAFEQVALKSGACAGVDVGINGTWQKHSLKQYYAKSKGMQGFAEIGGSTLAGEGVFSTIKKIERKWKVKYDVIMNTGRLGVNALFEHKPSREFIRHTLLSKSKEEQFYILTYHLIYYPLFWFLESQRQTHPLHASAVEANGQGVVICGLEGSGKTTLALKFMQEGASFLSDNLLFYNDRQILPCYELLRIHRHEEKLYSQHFEKINVSDIRKGFFRPKFRIERLSMKPDILLFPEFSQASYVKEIPKEEAVNRAIMLSYLPQELGDYASYRHLYNLLDTRFNPWVSVHQVLKELLSRTRCYRFGVVKADSVDANYRRLKEALWGRS